jgi:hypothetical protein
VNAETSIGPEKLTPPAADDSHETQPSAEDVDAEAANEFDMRHGLAGAEAKPFSKKPAGGEPPEDEQGDQKHPHNPSRYEGGQTIRELDMPDRKPREGKAGLADNGG